jgi:hypothetical protein
MHGELFRLFLADIFVPSPDEILVFAAPVLVLAAVWWLISRTDRVVHYMFPYLEWEHSLGWLNIRAERRANIAMRLVRFGVYVMLFDALFGIVWGAKGLQQLDHWSDPYVIGGLALRVGALAFCLAIWVLYLGTYVIPRIRAEREHAAWRKIQDEIEAKDAAKRARGVMEPQSRIKAPLRQPRTNQPLGLPKKPALTPLHRSRRSHGPGG